MTTTDDAELLNAYLAARDGAAFAAIVDRYGAMVRAAARRHVSDAHLADDVAQATFVVLARRASAIGERRSLAAWLLTTTRLCAMNARRRRDRARRRERAMADQLPPRDDERAGDALAEYGPMVDEAIARLGAAERDAIVWRFVDGLTFAQVGRRQGVSDEAARKRVARAIDRVRAMLARRGVRVGDVAAALAAINVGDALPAALRGSMADAAGGGASPAATSIASGAATATKAATAAVLATTLIAGAATTVALWPRGDDRTIAAPTMPASASASRSVDFGGGAVATLAGVRFLSDGDAPRWWAADGAAIDAPAIVGVDLDGFQRSLGGFDDGGWRGVGVLIALGGAPADAQLNVRYDVKRWGASQSWRPRPGTLMQYDVHSLPAVVDEAVLDVGLTRGAWEAGDTLVPDDVDARAAMLAPFPPLGHARPASAPTTRAVLRNVRATADGRTAVDYVNTPNWAGRDDTDWRPAIVTLDGRTVTRSRVVHEAGEMSIVFDVPFDEVAAAVHQTRAIEWRSLGTVRLAPTSRPAR